MTISMTATFLFSAMTAVAQDVEQKLRDIRQGRRVEVHLSTGKKITGYLSSTGPDELTLDTRTGEHHSVRMSSVKDVRIKPARPEKRIRQASIGDNLSLKLWDGSELKGRLASRDENGFVIGRPGGGSVSRRLEFDDVEAMRSPATGFKPLRDGALATAGGLGVILLLLIIAN